METPLFSPVITNKVHKESAIQVAAFLGGPLVAGYLVAHNFRQLGEPGKVKKTWLVAVAVFMVLVALAIIVPQSVPSVVFAVANVGVVQLFVQRFQSAKLKEHLEAGGSAYRFRRAIIISLAFTATIILLVLLAFAFTDLYILFT